MVLAELGRFLLQIHFWQQILRYHHRTMTLDNMRLVKLATVPNRLIALRWIRQQSKTVGRL